MSLRNIKISNFKTSSATDLSSMFSDCNALQEIDLKT